METKNPVGRPLKFATPELLQERIDEYYAWAELNEKPLTIERLAVFLDVDRHFINNYEERDEFCATIKKARNYILADKLEKGLGGKSNATMSIFDLKNNHAFADTQYLNMGGQHGQNPINQDLSLKIEFVKPHDDQTS